MDKGMHQKVANLKLRKDLINGHILVKLEK